MMLSRSGLSFRKLVPKRRSTSSDEEDGYGFERYEDASSLKAASKRQHRGTFWMSSPKQAAAAKKTKKNIPKPIVVIRGPESVHRISSPLPSLPDTLHSSASSLCSCDCHHPQISSGLISGKRSPGLCSVGLPKRSYESSLPSTPRLSESGRKTSVDAPHKRRNIMHMRSNSPEPTLNLLEALAIVPDTEMEPPEGRETPKPLIKEQRTPPREVSDNVQQLIRETDEAFKAVGSALAEARLASKTPTQHNQLTNIQPPRLIPATPSRTIVRKPQIVLSSHKSPTRVTSVSKTTRKKAKRQRSRPRLVTKPSNSRWTLTDNVTEMFNGRFFNRIEADEMLTPSQLHEMRQTRMAQVKPKKSNETIKTAVTVETDESETPINPFHLEDLPSRIGNSGVRLTVLSPMAEVPPPRLFDFEQVVRRDFSAPPLKVSSKREELSSEDKENAMMFKEMSFPSPPVKNPLRFVPRRQLPPLPTIPELTVTSPDSKTQKRPQASKAAPTPLPISDNYVYLKSTPFTLTMPTFRHGPIRLAKDDESKEPHVRADETTLDWTAFQMAILGGTGDFFSGTTDYIRRRWESFEDDEFDEATDLADWFDSLGFENGGLLIPETPPTPSLSSVTTAATETAEHSPVTPNLPIPVESEYPSGFWNEPAGDDRSPSTTIRSRRKKFAASGELGLRRWTGEGHPKRYVSRASVDSLPDSPMLDLIVDEAADDSSAAAGAAFTVPMGYNLGHDLGDFLKWEAQHAYAGGFFGSE